MTQQQLKEHHKQLLLRFRTALKEAGFYFEGRNIHISDSKTGHYVKFETVLTDSDNSPLELYAEEHLPSPPPRAWITTKKNTVETT